MIIRSGRNQRNQRNHPTYAQDVVIPMGGKIMRMEVGYAIVFGIIIEDSVSTPGGVARFKILLNNGTTHRKATFEILDLWDVED